MSDEEFEALKTLLETDLAKAIHLLKEVALI
jgi:hypothetical protein